MKKSIIAAFAAGVLAAVILFSVTGCFGTLKVNTGSYTTDTSVEKKLAEMKSVIDAYAIDEFDEEKAKEGLYYGYMLGLTDDKYAAYYSEEDYKKIVDELQGNFGGIADSDSFSHFDALPLLLTSSSFGWSGRHGPHSLF